MSSLVFRPLSWLSGGKKRSARATDPRRRAKGRRAGPFLEPLEDRCTPSVSVGANFGGMDQGYTPWGPLDPNGAVSDKYVVQIINTELAIFSKSGQFIE
jgi:hypothetical protein